MTDTSASLQLGWTQMGKGSSSSNGQQQQQQQRQQQQRLLLEDDSWKCCNRRGCRHRQAAFTNTRSSNEKLLRRRVSGQVIFCLHEANPNWFQGYFFPSSGGKPWGLLATQLEVDECLQCAEGGYRVVDLKVIPPNTSNNSSKESFPSVEWLGADMMELKSPHVRMVTEKFASGMAGAAMAEHVFKGLLNKFRAECEDTTTTLTARELFPDLAVVVGTMDLLMPIDKKEQELYKLMFED